MCVTFVLLDTVDASRSLGGVGLTNNATLQLVWGVESELASRSSARNAGDIVARSCDAMLTFLWRESILQARFQL